MKRIIKKAKFLQPDMMFRSIYEITPEFLTEQGIEAILFDIDNTIASYEVASPTEKMKAYFKSLEKAGLKMAFVSNNNKERVHVFNLDLGYFYIYKAKKPFSGGVKKCIKHLGLPLDKIVSVGDQLFTDCLAAHGAGLRFFMVAPVSKKESLFFKVKRRLERPFLQAFRERMHLNHHPKKHGKQKKFRKNKN